MKYIKLSLPLIGAVLCSSAFANDTSLLGNGLDKFSVLAGGYVTYGAGAVIDGDVGANGYITGGANATSSNNYSDTAITYGANAIAAGTFTSGAVTLGAGAQPGTLGSDVSLKNSALAQFSQAQSAISNMGSGTALAATMGGNITLAPGVYSSSALTTAAGTSITLDAGGAADAYWVFNLDTYLVTGANTTVQFASGTTNGRVLWNTGGYTSLGASTSLVGVVLSSGYISEGAGASISCGNAFSGSYVSVSASVSTSLSGCGGADSRGLGSGFDIVNGVAVSTFSAVSAVPEVKSGSLLLVGMGMIAAIIRRRKTDAIFEA